MTKSNLIVAIYSLNKKHSLGRLWNIKKRPLEKIYQLLSKRELMKQDENDYNIVVGD